jgi:hypothetical protein
MTLGVLFFGAHAYAGDGPGGGGGSCTTPQYPCTDSGAGWWPYSSSGSGPFFGVKPPNDIWNEGACMRIGIQLPVYVGANQQIPCMYLQ